jgi:hypothetical protein
MRYLHQAMDIEHVWEQCEFLEYIILGPISDVLDQYSNLYKLFTIGNIGQYHQNNIFIDNCIPVRMYKRMYYGTVIATLWHPPSCP